MNKTRALLTMVCCGLVGGAFSIATADETPVQNVVPPFASEEEYLIEAGVGTNPGRPFLINISGATLMENYIKAPASTNDFVDVDGDGRVVPMFIDNLAGVQPSNPYNAALHWVVTYRVVGSVNGYQELLDFGSPSDFQGCEPRCFTAPDIGINPQDPDGAGPLPPLPLVQNNAAMGLLSSDPVTIGYMNSVQFAANGGDSTSGFWNGSNPGAMPLRSWCVGNVPTNKCTYSAVPYQAGAGQPGGFVVDIAPIDVPSSWGTTVPGTPNYGLAPFLAGYGLNPRLNVNKDGTTFLDGSGNPFGFGLVTVVPPLNLFDGDLMETPADEDCWTVFDYDFAYTPVAAIVNLGTGYSEMTYTRIRHLLTTGRTECGENLVVVTRDTGSGTHNAFVNSFCVDPSHGVGEAIGGLSGASGEQVAGASFNPGNKSGSSALESTARNSRIGFTYSGAERGVTGSSAWISTGRLDAIGVLDDVRGGTVYARPNIANVLGWQTIDTTAPYNHIPLANRFNGYNVGGPGVLASIGDPFSSMGGADCNGADVLFCVSPGRMTPPMRNRQAAAYLNNLECSVRNFNAIPGDVSNVGSPGEFLASIFIINGSRAFTQDGTRRAQPCNMIRFDETFGVPVNDPLVPVVAAANALASAVYAQGNFGSVTLNGRTPTRGTVTAPARYSDARGTSGALLNFIRQDASTQSYDNAGAGDRFSNGVGARNRIGGDFDGNGLRNCNDALEMMRAYNDRINRPATFVNADDWQGGLVGDPIFGDRATNWRAPNGTGAIAGTATSGGRFAMIEVLGDFNSDGNFGRRWDAASGMFVADNADIRYWADGLAMDPVTGKLNRCAGFEKVDTSWQTVSGNLNFFGTMLATGAAYTAGASAADIAGPANRFTINFQPIGHDRRVDSYDIDHVFAQFRRNPNVTDNELNWDNTTGGATFARQNEAQYGTNAGFDNIPGNADDETLGNLSADINGDMKVNIDDITKLLGFLNTTICDVNLDGSVNNIDRDIIVANIGTRGGHARGDVNGDGLITQADLDQCFAPACTICTGCQLTSGQTVGFGCIAILLSNFGASGSAGIAGDANCTGVVDFGDTAAVLASFGFMCP